jgi:enolase
MSQSVTIKFLSAIEILDSRGNPTLSAQVGFSNGTIGTAAVPSGASTGKHEAFELRDASDARYLGKGVIQAVNNINLNIQEHFTGTMWNNFEEFDSELISLDTSGNKSKLGANTILAVSLAAAHAFASNDSNSELWEYLSSHTGLTPSLPVPMLNILNGGSHASNSTDVQEFMVIPAGFNDFSSALRAGVEIYHNLKTILSSKNHNLNVGDEGGFAPQLTSNEEAIELIINAIEKSGYKPGEDVFLGLDVAASELYDSQIDCYKLKRQGINVTSEELIALYSDWVDKFPIISIEDGLHEDDWAGWTNLTQKLGKKIQLVGDDLLVTNIDRINQANLNMACNAILLKPNQIGSLTETYQAYSLAKEYDWNSVMSHRSGETEDTTIADLAVGWGIGQIKTGAPARSDRVAKYNRLLKIEKQLGNDAIFNGKKVFNKLKL